ncbi:uncharacterized protein G2W53_027471 [Senna tora]|uniref:Uncharacterized protein n=1 Tax=Senna tora TaxID=362788 RepID=A0A834TJ10_9FABA|nr:uncharacterized protein G2W53_027471 [Senna tora]
MVEIIRLVQPKQYYLRIIKTAGNVGVTDTRQSNKRSKHLFLPVMDGEPEPAHTMPWYKRRKIFATKTTIKIDLCVEESGNSHGNVYAPMHKAANLEEVDKLSS